MLIGLIKLRPKLIAKLLRHRLQWLSSTICKRSPKDAASGCIRNCESNTRAWLWCHKITSVLKRVRPLAINSHTWNALGAAAMRIAREWHPGTCSRVTPKSFSNVVSVQRLEQLSSLCQIKNLVIWFVTLGVVFRNKLKPFRQKEFRYFNSVKMIHVSRGSSVRSTCFKTAGSLSSEDPNIGFRRWYQLVLAFPPTIERWTIGSQI